MGEQQQPRRGGQPRAGEKATKMLRVRLTEEEWAELERRAKRAGVSMSEYVRDRALG